MDLSGINSPIFLDKDGNTVNITTQVSTEGVSDVNTIIGSNNGDISFSLDASTNATSSYEIKNTSESLNYKFTGKSETVTAGDYFEIRVFPSTRNITLLDPNDELIIDTNFDGKTFSSGVTTFTANYIRFKYKQDTSNPTFEFFISEIYSSSPVSMITWDITIAYISFLSFLIYKRINDGYFVCSKAIFLYCLRAQQLLRKHMREHTCIKTDHG